MADTGHLMRLSKQLADNGKLIEAGWITMRLACIPKDASPAQLEDMRLAFMAGAQHLFSSIMTVLEPGEEPTSRDLNRLTLINAELEEFAKEFAMRVDLRSTTTTGSA